MPSKITNSAIATTSTIEPTKAAHLVLKCGNCMLALCRNAAMIQYNCCKQGISLTTRKAIECITSYSEAEPPYDQMGIKSSSRRSSPVNTGERLGWPGKNVGLLLFGATKGGRDDG
jgi:hypothetical protein